MLGEVQGTLAALSKSMDRVLDNQEVARTEVIAATEKLHTRLDEHAVSDSESFAAIHAHVGEGLGGLRDRIAQLEILPDRVESQGDSILSIEKRLEEAETMRKALDVARETNRRWQVGIVSGVSLVTGIIGSTHGTAVLKWFQTLVH
jgi:hypothetical protein